MAEKKQENKKVKVNNGEKTLVVTEKAYRVYYSKLGYKKGELKKSTNEKEEVVNKDDKE